MHALVTTVLALGVVWHAVRPGVWQADIPMASEGPLSVVRAIAVRLDPAEVQFDLVRRERELGGGWTIERMPRKAIVAFNAGQFTGAWPWGWLVQNGIELQEPGKGTLAMAFVVDSGGRVSLVTQRELASARGFTQLAFQSYPALLIDGAEPWELQDKGRGVDLEHRDSRLALGIRDDGAIVVAITRFTGLGRGGETLPWGPTVREMATFMRSLGCRRAMLLDGGISSQLAVRGGNGVVARWPNWRAVPLGLVVTSRHLTPR